MNIVRILKLYLLVLLPLLVNAQVSANAQPENQKGLAIMNKVIEQDDGFGDFESSVEMTIADGNGQSRVRKMRVSDLEIPSGGEKRLFVFDFPKDVRGTAVLSHSRNSEEKQWIYLPAFKRVKRISSANKSSPFVGSEFSYEDLASIELEKYQYRFLRSERYQGIDCHLVEMIPGFDHSGYERQIVYVDARQHIIRKVDYFDTRGTLLKTLELDDYKLFLNRYWRSLRMTMTNHQNQHKTVMLWNDVKYRNGINDQDLSVAALKRIR